MHLVRLVRLFLLGTVFTTLTVGAKAQSNPIEAKAAYLLAEESYGKGEMRNALGYLEEAISKLGTANAKILYLKVMTLKEISTTDTSVNRKLDQAIAEFEKAPDVADFNEEKTLEIVKIKMRRKKESAGEANTLQGLKAFEEESRWYLGATIDSLYVLHKQQFDEYFKRVNTPIDKVKPDGYIFFTQGLTTTDGIMFTGRRIHTYTKYHFNYIDENAGFSKAKNEMPALLRYYTDLMGAQPVERIKTVPNTVGGQLMTAVGSSYTWKSKDRMLILYLSQTTSGNQYTSTCLVTFTNNPEVLNAPL